LNKDKPLTLFNWKTHRFEVKWNPAEVTVSTFAEYLKLTSKTTIAKRMLVNLVENRLAFPLKDYPIKPNNDGTKDLDDTI
jgi:hypothetical protein